MSFPERWGNISETVKENAQTPDCIAGFPTATNTEGLPRRGPMWISCFPHRLYKFFQPYGRCLKSSWNGTEGEGKVVEIESSVIFRLRPVGQAQTWFGLARAVHCESWL